MYQVDFNIFYIILCLMLVFKYYDSTSNGAVKMSDDFVRFQ